MTLHLVEPGWGTRIVDMGRPGTRSLGVPVGGAADRTSFLIASALVGNTGADAGLEICGKGPRLQAACDLACVLYGATFEMSDGKRPGVTFTLHAGEVLTIGGTGRGMRAYFCVRGGLSVPEILGSRSSLDFLAGPMAFACAPSRIRQRFLPRGLFDVNGSQGPIHVLPGLQARWFDDAPFYRQEFTVTPASNRMGLRLQSEPLAVPAREMVSEPVCPGAVQVTRDGQCIVLGVDGQTIGGYPKIAQVISADLDRFGQLRPGQRVTFVRIDMEDAVAIFQQRERNLTAWLERLRLSLDG